MLLAATAGLPVLAQRQPVPRPFPTPGTTPARPAPARPAPVAPASEAAAPAPTVAAADAPTEQTLGVPIYPSAQYLASYDAGRGQRFHLFGTSAAFANLVRYYSVVLRERGRRVYDAPAIHQFETARFRDREMNFRPSVTIKDYTWNGAAGYIHAAPGAAAATFPTIIQITTLPEGTANR
jgi:hypothetical protein